MLDLNKLKDLPTDIFIHLLKTIIVAGILFSLGYINEVVFTKYLVTYEALKYPIYVILLLSLVYLVLRIYSRLKSTKPEFSDLDSDFKIVSKTFEHNMVSTILIKSNRKYKIIAKRNNLTSFKNKFKWTGGNAKITSRIKRHRVNMLGKGNVFENYEIQFGRTLNKGDETNIDFLFELDDPNQISVPFLADTIFEPTDFLKFIIIFDKPLRFKEVVCQEAASNGGNVIYSNLLDIPLSGKFEWEIRNPKLLHHYEIRWF